MFGFRRKTQQELDAAFLAAVEDHEFERAQKLVDKKGANPLATDTEGNTAFHKLTGADVYKSPSYMDDFICFLVQKGLDINARNNKGRTCVHLMALGYHPSGQQYYYGGDDYGDRCTGEEMLGYLINRGARIDDKDDAGNTVVHIAAVNGLKDFIGACVSIAYPLVSIQNNAGQYPHDCALAGRVKHQNLAKFLKKNCDAYQAHAVEEKRVVTVTVETTETAQTKSADTGWILLERDEVAHISLREAIGYKLTEIFNFSARTYQKITHNLKTGADASETRGFDDFADKAAFEAARQELLRQGGQAAEASVYGSVLDKKRSPFSKDA